MPVNPNTTDRLGDKGGDIKHGHEQAEFRITQAKLLFNPWE